MKPLNQTTLNKLKAFILNDEDFKDVLYVAQSTLTDQDSFKNYFKASRQLKNLNGFNAFVGLWLNDYNQGGYIALLDKKYLDCSYVIIDQNIIDLDYLYIDFKSDIRSYFELNPKSL
jgi:hypothetical protein